MWHEARKQEKKIRGMMVDYKRRAERRRDYYERIKQDPAQFLQVHGRPAKIHLDPAIAIAADSPATMMPWQGQSDNLIDRFDVRAHLDIIPDYKIPTELPKVSGEELVEDRKTCYERYRTLVQNDFLGVNEDKFLYQIFLEERYGPVLKPGYEDDKKKSSDKKAAIGYVYEDSTFDPLPVETEQNDEDEENEDEKEEDLSDIDLDVTVDVSVLTSPQCAEMNSNSVKYGMVDDDFITYLMQDKDEAEQLKLAREIEEEKAMYSGRKSRRERRALREKKLAGRKITSPPSYAARDSPTYTPMRHSASKSRSRSPPNAGKIMFITSFGGEGSDGELGLKSGVDKNSKQENISNSDSVIGPKLPEKNGEDQSKTGSKSLSVRKSSLSSSDSSSSSKERKRKKSSSDKYHKKRYKSKRSKGSRSPSSSSASRSSCPSSSPKRGRAKPKRSRRSSSSSSSRRSRSVSHSRSKTKSHSHSQWKTRSRSRSKSTSKMTHERSNSPSLPPPPVKSYYRHSLSRSNSAVSDDSDDKSTRSSHNSSVSSMSKSLPLLGKAGPATKSRATPQERLKKKMQIALRKQYKADKKAQMEKSEKQLQERQDREEELREMAIKLRQRERERRHRIRGYGADSDSDSAWNRTPDHSNSDYASHRDKIRSHSSNSSSSSEAQSPKPKASTSRYRSRSKSKSPPPKPIRRYLLEKPRNSPPKLARKCTPPPRRSPPRHSSPRHSPLRHSPLRHSPLRHSPLRHSPSRRSSPRHSPQRSYRRSPPRSSYSRDYRHEGCNARRSSSRSPSRKYSSSYRHLSSRQGSSPTRSRPLLPKPRPLVDY